MLQDILHAVEATDGRCRLPIISGREWELSHWRSADRRRVLRIYNTFTTTEDTNNNMSYLALDSNAWQVTINFSFHLHFRRYCQK